ncbi:hypothetical protein H206_05294 [Candidatus Electrothrix aarhusensis]|uniref:Uncharacterized protein n=1 Tax=Candidatus Electrothrix aarhusensis TaxID=1859131 RepID=A0A3S3R1Z3_9BACT|nr:hypothetical protein H206_05294 [Candidatus Electrothrix aarhusensis]
MCSIFCFWVACHSRICKRSRAFNTYRRNRKGMRGLRATDPQRY